MCAQQRIFRVQTGRHRFVQKFGNGVGFEKDFLIDLEHGDFAVRRNLQEPVGFVPEINKCDLELDVFGAHGNHGALDPRSGERADQVVFDGHEITLSIVVIRRS